MKTTYLLILFCAVPVCKAQVEVIGSAGYHKPFLDEEGGLVGAASVRIPLSRRFSVRPDFVGGSFGGYRRTFLLGSATFDLNDPSSTAVAYLVGSAGLSNTYAKSIRYSYSEGTALLGAGVRYSLTPRWNTHIEFRVGPDAFPLVTFGLGYKIGNWKR